MKIKKGYIKTKTFDGWAVTAVEKESLKNRIMLTLNETASEIWDMLAEGKSTDEIVSQLSQKYDIPTKQAQNGVALVTDTLLREGVLEE